MFQFKKMIKLLLEGDTNTLSLCKTRQNTKKLCHKMSLQHVFFARSYIREQEKLGQYGKY